MKDPHVRLFALFARQWGLVTRAQALALGISRYEIRRELAAGRWVTVHPGVYRLAGRPLGSETQLLAACLATNGWASHEWAAWLWEMTGLPKSPPAVAVRRGSRPVPQGITVHRCSRPRYATPPVYRDIPCTDRLTTLVDFASVARSDQEVDTAVDKGLAEDYFSLATLLADLDNHSAERRSGAAAVRASLRRRGLIGAPQPSVLESMVLRLLARDGIRPAEAEKPVWVADHCYRLDFTIVRGLALEVDGYLYHPDLGRRRDNRRRNELLAAGWGVLVYTWHDIKEDGDRVLAEVRAALATLGTPQPSRP